MNKAKNIIANNKKANFDYHIKERLEAGIVLTGTEVKSLRCGKASINEGHVIEEDGVLYLVNSNIPLYDKSKFVNHSPNRPRILLLHKKQINKLRGLVEKKGITIVPLQLYFNKKNLAKIEIGLAEGKKKHDKRQAIKEREWGRQKSRLHKGNIET